MRPANETNVTHYVTEAEEAIIEKYGDQLIHLDGRPRRLLDEVEIDETPIWARE